MSGTTEADITRVRSTDDTEIAVFVSGDGPDYSIAKVSEQEISGLRAAPTWPARVAAAGTVPRELLAFGGQAFDPSRAATIAIPVLLLVGSDSPPEIKADPEIVAAALPDARIQVLEGQMHLAHLSDPQTFAGHVLAFLQER